MDQPHPTATADPAVHRTPAPAVRPDDPDAAREVVAARRATLAGSLDRLLGRVDATVDRVRAVASPEGARRMAEARAEDFRDAVIARARRNPVAAAMMAAGVALPAWRLLRKLPPSLLLAGGGAALLAREDRPDAPERPRARFHSARSTATPSRRLPPPAPEPSVDAPPPAMRDVAPRPRPLTAPPATYPAAALRRRRRPARRDGTLNRAARMANDNPVAVGLLGLALGIGALALSPGVRRTAGAATDRAAGAARAAGRRLTEGPATVPGADAPTNGRRPGARKMLRRSIAGGPPKKVETPSQPKKAMGPPPTTALPRTSHADTGPGAAPGPAATSDARGGGSSAAGRRPAKAAGAASAKSDGAAKAPRRTRAKSTGRKTTRARPARKADDGN
ncbi:hypothetical protein [Jannaschia sp. LMIT008]|uniref:hypothetical protein n=1 Tax=Jannaschia maritima TaxID=3032585 RepID=UPI002811CC77|nr:hypothetical protein [Jannaschia sp. LMIT008]